MTLNLDFEMNFKFDEIFNGISPSLSKEISSNLVDIV